MAILQGATGVTVAVILTVHDSALHSLLHLTGENIHNETACR